MSTYKISIKGLLYDFSDPSSVYFVEVIANNSHSGYFERYENLSLQDFLFISSSLYINNPSSEKYYEILGRSSMGGATFEVYSGSSTPDFDQISIEYVGGIV